MHWADDIQTRYTGMLHFWNCQNSSPTSFTNRHLGRKPWFPKTTEFPTPYSSFLTGERIKTDKGCISLLTFRSSSRNYNIVCNTQVFSLCYLCHAQNLWHLSRNWGKWSDFGQIKTHQDMSLLKVHQEFNLQCRWWNSRNENYIFNMHCLVSKHVHYRVLLICSFFKRCFGE